MVNSDVRAALPGDHEAEKRLTDAGVLVPCQFCKSDCVWNLVNLSRGRR